MLQRLVHPLAGAVVRQCVLLSALLPGLVSDSWAQQSASYQITDQSLNAGGRPVDGAIASSLSYHIRVDTMGEAVVGALSRSATYWVDSGFAQAYLPPREVSGVRFPGVDALAWDAEPSAGSYNLYRDARAGPPWPGYGYCEQSGLGEAQTTDPDRPVAGAAFLYLITVENRLGEEGTMGNSSLGDERPNANPCP